MTGHLAVETERLGRVYVPIRRARHATRVVALDNVNLQVRRGEMFGVVGPNGAGKTTLINILTTELAPTTGTARVAGFDVARYSRWVRPKVAHVGECGAGLLGLATVGSYLTTSARRAHIAPEDTSRRIGDLLEIVGLRERWHTRVRHLSTGLRQRMNIVRGFLTHPTVLFLDQPTLGLDVIATREVHGYMRRWLRGDPMRTIVFTTHALKEADDLCDRVAVLRQGKLCACDAPGALKARVAWSAAPTLEEVFVRLTGNRQPRGAAPTT